MNHTTGAQYYKKNGWKKDLISINDFYIENILYKKKLKNIKILTVYNVK